MFLYIFVDSGIEIWGVIKEMKQMDSMTEDELTEYLKEKKKQDEEFLKGSIIKQKTEDE